MMIIEIQKLFEERPSESLYNLSLHFGVEREVMEKMLDVLVSKGRLVRKDVKKEGGHCGKCNGHCDGSKDILYERTGNP
jgi:hypothetical protein